jgi:flavin reductase (DIM6/NTAB) family NADH-FMN oxidoreductase RutF
VCNFVTRELGEQVNLASFPRGVNEREKAGLWLRLVRVAASPCALECRRVARRL